MFDRRANNVKIFNDTMDLIKQEPVLKQAVRNSIKNQKLFLEKEEYDFKENEKKLEEAHIVVSKKRTFEAAQNYVKAGKKVCVLNFASSVNPGGGVRRGASAQEECLCRCSTLYPCLNIEEFWNQFYNPHRDLNDALYNDDCIYTPDVYVVKTDSNSPQRIDKKDWYQVDVLTCAAPNLRHHPSNIYNPEGGKPATGLTKEKLQKLLTSRIKRIFQVAMSNGAEVLILGAFGCGAFRNPPEVVAQVFKELTQEYKYYFDTIEYAVYCRGYETENYDTFREVLVKK